MSWRAVAVLALALCMAGCVVPAGSSSGDGPRARCLSQPGRGESYSPDRPLFFLFCIESP